ncbi:MmcQ/YjbR family DNA-binding protein [Draconibacterium sp. IB214405]|uniref:MmcQ/YjbR family DNA-binding protein n=1 Tax=Draconibacterium sp. IB214405 TaxID=3097352 RepID=UPI002A14AAF7|nr:MmcQ/YjbR family DNA-binding protein [Draconibacterium sp. IB214405]MDX8338227.1 MmcQ/YjbR family DNA-binding protein [Draconibacterium sp. IB214405]
MNIEEIREYCLQKKGVTESFPFDETTLVFKVMNKMFCLLGLDDFRLSLKNDPDKNIELRAHYPAIYEGYHLHKQMWNTIELNGTVPSKLMCEMIDESYDLIVVSLTKKLKEELKNL